MQGQKLLDFIKKKNICILFIIYFYLVFVFWDE